MKANAITVNMTVAKACIAGNSGTVGLGLTLGVEAGVGVAEGAAS